MWREEKKADVIVCGNLDLKSRASLEAIFDASLSAWPSVQVALQSFLPGRHCRLGLSFLFFLFFVDTVANDMAPGDWAPYVCLVASSSQ